MERRTFLLNVAGLFGAAAAAVAGVRTANPEGPIVLNAGTYVLSAPLVVGSAGIRGAGPSATILRAAAGYRGALVIAREGTFALSGLTVEGSVRTQVSEGGARFVRIG